jgi:hypothetical protein
MASLHIPEIPLTQLEDSEATALDLTARRMVMSPPPSELIAIVVMRSPDRGRR